MFVRSWSVRPNGWYRALSAEAQGAIRLADRDIPVVAFPITDKRILDAIDRGILTNTTRPARSITRRTWEGRNHALPLLNYGHSSRSGNPDCDLSPIGLIRCVILLCLFPSAFRRCQEPSNRGTVQIVDDELGSGDSGALLDAYKGHES